MKTSMRRGIWEREICWRKSGVSVVLGKLVLKCDIFAFMYVVRATK